MFARLLARAVYGSGIAFSLITMLSLWSVGKYPYAGKLSLCCLLLAAILPRASSVLLLATLPMFGNKPGTMQLHYLLLVQSAAMLGIALRLCVDRFRDRSGAAVQSGPPAPLALGLLYVLVSALSLSATDWTPVFESIGGHLSAGHPRILLGGFQQYLETNEASTVYPLLSVLFTIHAAAFALQLVELGSGADSKSRFPLQLSAGILGGLVVSLIAGLLDYYSLIDLTALRGLDPTANPGGVQFRLQSFFGHSGWFAEYLTLAVPFVIVLLALPLSFAIRVSMMLGILLLGEWALILTFQRGGWVSYPVTLCAVWGAIYVGRRLERGERDVMSALRSSALKVAVSLPLTIALSFLIIFGLSKLGASAPTAGAGIASYVERFQDIQKASDRTDFMYAGWLIGSLHPFLGAGSESFSSQFKHEFLSPQGSFFKLLDLPLHGSAHNVYFQTFAGKGALGVLLLLTVLLHLIVPSVRTVLWDVERTLGERLVLLSGSCFAAAFLVYGMVQEIFYVQLLQVLFFAVLGMVSLVPGAHGVLPRRSERLLYQLISFMFLGHILWESRLLTSRGGAAPLRKSDYGCFRDEVAEDGRIFRWCANRAAYPVPVEWEAGQRVIKISVRLQPPVLTTTLEMSAADLPLTTISLLPADVPTVVTLQLPESLFERTFTDASGRELLLVSFRSDSWFVPSISNPASPDGRLLSFRIYGP